MSETGFSQQGFKKQSQQQHPLQHQPAPSRLSPKQQQVQQLEADQRPHTYASWALDKAWKAWLVVDGAVAWLFGLDESKYQWAIDRYNRRQAELALQSRAFDGQLSSTAPHVPPDSKVMRADAENPALAAGENGEWQRQQQQPEHQQQRRQRH